MSATHGPLVMVCIAAALVAAEPLRMLIDRTVASRSDFPRKPVGYPIVAAVTAAGFGGLALRFGASATLPAYLFLVALLVVLSFVDLATKTLPRRLVHAMLAVGIVLLGPISALTGEPSRLLWASVGALGAFVVLTVLHFGARGGFGFGDVRLGAALGWYLAWQEPRYVPIGLFLAFAMSAIAGLALMVIGRAGRRTAIPFGPFLALGAVVPLIAGPLLVSGA